MANLKLIKGGTGSGEEKTDSTSFLNILIITVPLVIISSFAITQTQILGAWRNLIGNSILDEDDEDEEAENGGYGGDLEEAHRQWEDTKEMARHMFDSKWEEIEKGGGQEQEDGSKMKKEKPRDSGHAVKPGAESGKEAWVKPLAFALDSQNSMDARLNAYYDLFEEPKNKYALPRAKHLREKTEILEAFAKAQDSESRKVAVGFAFKTLMEIHGEKVNAHMVGILLNALRDRDLEVVDYAALFLTKVREGQLPKSKEGIQRGLEQVAKARKRLETMGDDNISLRCLKEIETKWSEILKSHFGADNTVSLMERNKGVLGRGVVPILPREVKAIPRNYATRRMG